MTNYGQLVVSRHHLQNDYLIINNSTFSFPSGIGLTISKLVASLSTLSLSDYEEQGQPYEGHIARARNKTVLFLSHFGILSTV